MSVEIKILKTVKFSVQKLWPYSTGFLIYDLTAQGFSIMTFLQEGIVIDFTSHRCLRFRRSHRGLSERLIERRLQVVHRMNAMLEVEPWKVEKREWWRLPYGSRHDGPNVFLTGKRGFRSFRGFHLCLSTLQGSRCVSLLFRTLGGGSGKGEDET